MGYCRTCKQPMSYHGKTMLVWCPGQKSELVRLREQRDAQAEEIRVLREALNDLFATVDDEFYTRQAIERIEIQGLENDYSPYREFCQLMQYVRLVCQKALSPRPAPERGKEENHG